MPNHCVLYSHVGPIVPYHQSVSGQGPIYGQNGPLSQTAHRNGQDQWNGQDPWLCEDGQFACTITFDNTQNIFYGMTQVLQLKQNVQKPLNYLCIGVRMCKVKWIAVHMVSKG